MWVLFVTSLKIRGIIFWKILLLNRKVKRTILGLHTWINLHNGSRILSLRIRNLNYLKQRAGSNPAIPTSFYEKWIWTRLSTFLSTFFMIIHELAHLSSQLFSYALLVTENRNSWSIQIQVSSRLLSTSYIQNGIQCKVYDLQVVRALGIKGSIHVIFPSKQPQVIVGNQ